MNQEKRQFLSRVKSYLCPPGDGVFTVHTAKERKAALQKKLYQSQETKEILERWQESLEQILSGDKVSLLGICSDSGGGILRGANWGPLFIRQALFQELHQENANWQDWGDIRVIPHLLLDDYLNQKTLESCRQSLYGDSLSPLPVSPLSIASDFLSQLYALNPQTKILGLGGDHSVSYPLVKEYLQSKKRSGKKVAVIHFDAHTDLLEQRLGIDICFGSWAYHILPYLPSPQHLIQVGLRASGKPKSYWESRYQVQQYWSQEVKDMGASSIGEKIKKFLLQNQVDEIYVSFDVDCLDQSFASSTGTPEPGGLSPHEPLLLLQEIIPHIPLTGADMVEIAPFITHPNTTPFQGGLEATLMNSIPLCQYFIDSMSLN